MGSQSGKQSVRQVPIFHNDEKEHRALLAQEVTNLGRGQVNNGGSVTLTANATTTTVSDFRVGANSRIHLSPTTAKGAAALTNTYVSSKADGSFILTHSNTADVDKTFDYTIFS